MVKDGSGRRLDGSRESLEEGRHEGEGGRGGGVRWEVEEVGEDVVVENCQERFGL